MTGETVVPCHWRNSAQGGPITLAGDTTAGPDQYGWLGSKQRDADSLGDFTLMGRRLYNPTTGRFLQVDPVAGGSCNRYDYVCQDPIDGNDLTGLDMMSSPQPLMLQWLGHICHGTWRKSLGTIALSPASYAWYFGGWQPFDQDLNTSYGAIDTITYAENSVKRGFLSCGCLNGNGYIRIDPDLTSEVHRFFYQDFTCSGLWCGAVIRTSNWKSGGAW